jgi:lipopolysaccharide export LptBFGC system permease protein LptF
MTYLGSTRSIEIGLALSCIFATALSWRVGVRYKRSQQQHFGKFGTGVMLVFVWFVLFLVFTFGARRY